MHIKYAHPRPGTNSTTTTTYVEVRDTFAPTWLNCPDDIFIPTAPNANRTAVSWLVPTPIDNIGVASQNSTADPGAVFRISPEGSSGYPVVYTAVDDSGNVGTCTFRIIVQDPTDPTIVCPTDTSLLTDPTQNYTTVVQANLVPLVLSDNDGTPTVLTLNQTRYGVGTHNVTLTAKDRSGRTSSCVFKITVRDTEPPVITNCRPVQDFDTSQTSGVYNAQLTLPSATDNVQLGNATLYDTSSGSDVQIPLSSNYSISITTTTPRRTLRFDARDIFNNINSCTISVSVNTAGSSTSNTSASSSSDSTVIIGAAIGAVALVVLIAAAIIFAQRRNRRKMLPHDFGGILSMMEGLPQNSDGPVLPREIKREHVKIVGNLGKGNFGSVDKGTLDEQRALGIPAYLVAIKQLLSKRNEDRLSLLEEAAIMAQFVHPHCVRLIGVVTVGDPLMVGRECLCLGVFCMCVCVCVYVCCVVLLVVCWW